MPSYVKSGNIAPLEGRDEKDVDGRDEPRHDMIGHE